MKNYTHFYIKDIFADFSQMGVDKWEFPFTNGDEYLLEDGKIYGKHENCEDNERRLVTYFLPDWFDKNNDDHDYQILEDMHDLLMRNYGIWSENFDIQFLTEEDNLEIRSSSKYVRTVGDYQSKVRTQIYDKWEETQSLLKDIKDEKVKSDLIGRMREVA